MEQAVQKLVAQTAKHFKLPTIAVGVYSGGKEYYVTQGRLSPFGPKADADTVYPIASASKAFIAAAVLQLVEQKKLELDKPVVSYLPDFALYTPERTKALTVRDALCHRSGLARHDVTLFTNQETSLADMIYQVRYLEPSWPARQRFCYQNHMFGMASLLVEKVSGMPWGAYVARNIFRPLGMARSYTRFFAFAETDGNYARPRTNLLGLNLPSKAMDPDSTGCAGAISCSAHDLLQWAKANLQEGRYDEKARIFSKSSADELHGKQMPIKPGEMSPYVIDEITDPHYGLGWFVEQYRGTPVVHHGGTLSGYKSLVGFVPGQDFAFAILVNQNGSQAPSALGYSLFDHALGLEPIEWNARYAALYKERLADAKAKYKEATAAPANKPDGTGCGGSYHNPAYGTFTVDEKNGRLWMRNLGVKLTFFPSALDEFALGSPMMGMAFPCRFRREGAAVTGLDVKLEPDLDHYVPFDRV